ncbi:glycosyltransferase family 4 protein [Thermococcus sp.]
MKVVMTVSNPFKPDPRVYKEAKSLVNAGYEVYVIAWDREGKYPEEEVVDGIKVIRLGPRAAYGVAMVLKLPLFYLNAFRLVLKLKPEVVHTHDFDTAVLGFIFKLLTGTKWIYDVHDLYETFIPPGAIRKSVFSLDKVFILSADSVIVVNRGFVSLFRKWGRPGDIHVVMNSIEDIGQKFEKHRRFTVFYGGVLSKGRFILEMIRISRELGVPLRIAGFGTLEDRVRKTCKHPCEFLGYLPRDKALKEMGMAHATFILYDPSSENNRLATPNKLFEAMALETALLVVDGSTAAEIVREGRCGLPCEYDEKNVRENLLKLMESPKDVRKMGRSGRRLFLKKYRWERFEDVLVRLYGGKAYENSHDSRRSAAVH